MNLVPLKITEANRFVTVHHRHNKATPGARFCIGLENEGQLIGVAIVGRPISRVIDTSTVAEVLRLCVCVKAPKGACSKLYSACWRAWRAMGGTRLITYTLQRESGASLRGAGWRVIGEITGREWNCPSRPRQSQPVYSEDKLRWEIV